MRNKLGDQVVGTGWKGRMVLRAYKTPANPKTCSQRANRDMQKNVLALYQTNVGPTPAKVASWDTDALPRSISGYNLFMMLGRSSRIDCDATHNGVANLNGHYTVTKDLSTAYICWEEASGPTFGIQVDVGDVQAGDDIAFAVNVSGLGITDDVTMWVCDERSKNKPPTDGDRDGLVNCWDMDEVTTCLAVPAISIYTP